MASSSTIGGFDMSFYGIPPAATAAFGSIAMDGDEYVLCNRCGYGGCDLRVSGCGCTLHTRCLQLNDNGPLSACPMCQKPTQGLALFPMSFREIDEAHRTATSLSKNRGKKRKGGSGSDPTDEAHYISDRRTGRWTNEETAYSDKLIATFTAGNLPVSQGVKLNEFLGNMLKSKQSRLTKKMKNAKLSTKVFQRTKGCLDDVEARVFSDLEAAFFQSVHDLSERAEIKFHMQKEWREQFCQVCAKIGQPLDADAWLSSVEEMDQRASQAKDAARMAKRKLMMGIALKTDCQNADQGVFIENPFEASMVEAKEGASNNQDHEELLSLLGDDKNLSSLNLDVNGRSSSLHSAPFLARTTTYLQRHAVPFEHVDLWVPSYVGDAGSQAGQGTTCRLCYAGGATADSAIDQGGKTSHPLTPDEKFNLFAFGDYSQKFSFDVGCGLPGRVYESGRPTWEQGVHNANDTHFERCGAAREWGIKTVLGIPIASPTVGRIVVALYSFHDRPKDEDLVSRLSEEFTKLMPAPKWKLVVDIGGVEETTPAPAAAGVAVSQPQPPSAHPGSKDDFLFSTDAVLTASAAAAAASGEKDPRIEEIVTLLGEFMPSDPESPSSNYLSGFLSLRLLLLRETRSIEEEEFVRTILDSYSSYIVGGRERSDIAVNLARDYIFLSQKQDDPSSFLGLEQSLMSSEPAEQEEEGALGSGLSLFGLPSISSSLQNSPALIPIPAPGGIIDSLSIVSN